MPIVSAHFRSLLAKWRTIGVARRHTDTKEPSVKALNILIHTGEGFMRLQTFSGRIATHSIDCRLLLHMWRGLSACLSRACAPQKRLNRSRCRGSGVLKEPRITGGEPDLDHHGKGTVSGTAILDLADGQHSQLHSRGGSSDATSGYHYSVNQSISRFLQWPKWCNHCKDH